MLRSRTAVAVLLAAVAFFVVGLAIALAPGCTTLGNIRDAAARSPLLSATLHEGATQVENAAGKQLRGAVDRIPETDDGFRSWLVGSALSDADADLVIRTLGPIREGALDGVCSIVDGGDGPGIVDRSLTAALAGTSARTYGRESVAWCLLQLAQGVDQAAALGEVEVPSGGVSAPVEVVAPAPGPVTSSSPGPLP